LDGFIQYLMDGGYRQISPWVYPLYLHPFPITGFQGWVFHLMALHPQDVRFTGLFVGPQVTERPAGQQKARHAVFHCFR